MSTRVAINGFGRIGRLFLRAAQKIEGIEFAAINDLGQIDALAHLFKYDSVHGRFPGEVSVSKDTLVVNGQAIRVLNEKDPAKLPWKELDVSVVFECTGKFRDIESVTKHLLSGADKVLVSSPMKDVVEIVRGVNDSMYDPEKHHIVSAASCTTNCLAPLLKVLDENFGVICGFLTTTHAYTNDQVILDFQHKDLRRARAAGISMIPTSTGAAKSIGKVLPKLAGRLDGVAIRVPVPDGSLVDLTVVTSGPGGRVEVNEAFKQASQGELRGILEYCEEPIVSVDVIGNPHSAIFDSLLTSVIVLPNLLGLVKIFAWYDNEWAYSCRMAELATRLL